MLLLRLKLGHNPYFSRWFSAITLQRQKPRQIRGHNPYFSRWFSAIYFMKKYDIISYTVTILILVDGFLQSVISNDKQALLSLSQSLF